MKSYSVLLLPLAISSYDRKTVMQTYRETKEALSAYAENMIMPEEVLTTPDAVTEFAAAHAADLVIFQNISFSNGAFAAECLSAIHCPIVLWTVREPKPDGGMLRLNALTGAFSVGNSITSMGRTFVHVYGSPQEEETIRQLGYSIRAARLLYELRSCRIASVGGTPTGFGFGAGLVNDLLRTFGVRLQNHETREIMMAADALTEKQANRALEEASQVINGLSAFPDDALLRFAKLSKAFQDFVNERHIDALASRCWPDFFEAYKAPVCAVLSLLNDRLVPAACEADVNGALSMLVGVRLTERPCFFGDPVSMDEEENTITFWHCGTGACSLADKKSGVKAGIQFARKMGPTVEYAAMPCEQVCILRIGKDRSGNYRMLVIRGEALDKPQQFSGTTAVIRIAPPVRATVSSLVKEGWEPHYAIAYGDCADTLAVAAEMLGIPLTLL